jgi:hypothetical protein
LNDPENALLRLAADQPIFRIEARIDSQLFGARNSATFRILAGSVAPLESEIVRDAKQPAAKIFSGFILAQMLKQREEDFLKDVFSVRKLKAKGREIPEQRIPEAIKESNNYIFQRFGTVGRGLIPQNRQGG